MLDVALESNRRLAWAKFYRQRTETEATLMWAAEIAEWLDRSGMPLPDVCQQLVTEVRSRLSANDQRIIARYVDGHLSPAVLRSQA